MKILMVNGSDIEGGASRAACRLLQGISDRNIEAQMLVQRKFGHDPQVVGPRSSLHRAMELVRPSIEQLLVGITPGKTNGPFSAAFLPDGLNAQWQRIAPDIVHLHWVARMMRLETLRDITVPVVWTLHDSWAFTGGCYLPQDCTRYRQSCGQCPVLNSIRENDLSNRIWRRKLEAWRGIDLTVIAPSRWMAACAQTSSLFRNARIEVIPNGLDVSIYRPQDKRAARGILSLPPHKKLLLFGAKSATKDPNKGFHLLKEAVKEIPSTLPRETMELVVFGNAEPAVLRGIGLKVHYLGCQHDDANLALIYAACDAMILPSRQENLPYVVMEAMACGTPCVAFNQGGVPDLIHHRHNGYLAHPFDPVDLACGIAWVMEDDERSRILAARAREKIVGEFSLTRIAEKHLALYLDILHRTRIAGRP